MFKKGLFKNIFQKVDQIFTGRGRIDEELFEELEEALIAADLNVHTTLRLMEELRSAVKDERLKESDEVVARLKAFLTGVLLGPDGAGVKPTPRRISAVPAPAAAAVVVPDPVVATQAVAEAAPPPAAPEPVKPLSRFMSWLNRTTSVQPAAVETPSAPAAVPAPPAEVTPVAAEAVEEFAAGLSEALIISPTAPTVYLVVGVNGVGKTTSIAKLAYGLKQEGKRVILGAADTFRAAAVDQLALWGERIGVEVIKGRDGADPASVVYDAVQAAIARGADYVIVDTAGRLHNKANLMEELKKINRVLMRARDGRAADETLLVLDATTGQNAVSQAKEFKNAVDVTGLILAKLDGTARGGIVITIKDELGIPIKLVGTGEKPSDLAPFDAQEFVEALFG